MKSTAILILTVWIALSSYSFGGDIKKVKVEGVIQAFNNADYKKLFELMPFELLPLHEEKRVVESKRLKVIRDERNAPVGFAWSSRDGSLSVRLRKMNAVGHFRVTKKDASEDDAHFYFMRVMDKGWEYWEQKNRK